ncbi:MAG: winged helix-turn-helix domain-containing protein, partial [Halorhabdus sp.]
PVRFWSRYRVCHSIQPCLPAGFIIFRVMETNREQFLYRGENTMTMASENQYMTGPGRDKAATAEQVHQLMEDSDRPVWSASSLAEYLDISRPTATDRLKELHQKEWVKAIDVGNTTAYYIPDTDELDLVEKHKQSLTREFEDKFVGLQTAPWTAVHPNDGPAEAGDKIQIRVEGTPGNWRQVMTNTWDNRRAELIYEETTADETQALISGELYAKPTTPIEHTDYPDDYDLEQNIGAEVMETEKGSALLATGVKSYLIRPRNDAVFLKDVSVDWMSPKGHGQELETHSLAPDKGFVEQMLDENPHGEVGEGWLKNMLALGAIELDEESIEWLVNHENSPVDSEEEVRELLEEAEEEREDGPPAFGYEEVDEEDIDDDTEVI